MADGIVQLQPDSTGKKVDTSELTVGANTVERQRLVIADSGTAAALVPVLNADPAAAAYAIPVRPIPAAAFPVTTQTLVPGRGSSGRVIFREDFSRGILGMFNDGSGGASTDWDVLFNGEPTARLDPQNNSSTGTATGGNQQLTLGGSAATYTVGGSGTLVGTSTQTGSPTPRVNGLAGGAAGGYIVLNGLASGGPTSDGNSYVLTYASAVVTGSANNWTVTFSGVAVANIAGTVGGGAASVTTANVGSAVMAVNNPNPNATGSPVTTGVVFKRRIDDGYSGKFGHAFWSRATSKSAATSFTSVFTGSIYNRDGQNFWAARCLLQCTIGMNPGTFSSDNALMWYVTSTSSAGFLWVPFAFLRTNSTNQHTWEPGGGSWDRAGCWHYWKIIADFANKVYVSIQIDDTVYAITDSMYQGIGDTGAKSMHFSVELAQAQSSTRRFWNVSPPIGTLEG